MAPRQIYILEERYSRLAWPVRTLPPWTSWSWARVSRRRMRPSMSPGWRRWGRSRPGPCRGSGWRPGRQSTLNKGGNVIIARIAVYIPYMRGKTSRCWMPFSSQHFPSSVLFLGSVGLNSKNISKMFKWDLLWVFASFQIFAIFIPSDCV